MKPGICSIIKMDEVDDVLEETTGKLADASSCSVKAWACCQQSGEDVQEVWVFPTKAVVRRSKGLGGRQWSSPMLEDYILVHNLKIKGQEDYTCTLHNINLQYQ